MCVGVLHFSQGRLGVLYPQVFIGRPVNRKRRGGGVVYPAHGCGGLRRKMWEDVALLMQADISDILVLPESRNTLHWQGLGQSRHKIIAFIGTSSKFYYPRK